jgi:L-2-hydroxyglutarate oxidase LhgO
MDTEQVDCVVIGAGVIGLAVARALARSGREVIVLETASTIGTETSSRNSEVIHAGLYYPQHSLKARLCVAGKQELYRYCMERHEPHLACGKLIVATSQQQIATLERLFAQAVKNGVNDLQWLDGAQVRDMEPAVRCVAALHSPSSGIIDSHALMLGLQGDAENAGALFAFHSPVEAGEILSNGIALAIEMTQAAKLSAQTGRAVALPLTDGVPT